MKIIDVVFRISIVYMIVMIPGSIIQLLISVYLHGTGFCISVFEAVAILICTVAWWVVYLKLKQQHRWKELGDEL